LAEKAAKERYKVEQAARLERALLQQAQAAAPAAAAAAAAEGAAGSSRPQSPERVKSPSPPPPPLPADATTTTADHPQTHEAVVSSADDGEGQGGSSSSEQPAGGGLAVTMKQERPSSATHTALHQREAQALSPRALQAIYHKNLLAELSWLPDQWEQAVRATVKQQGREVASPSKKKWRAARQATMTSLE